MHVHVRPQDYFSRALKRWDIPLVGCIPELKDLSCPTMADYSKLLKSPMISGASFIRCSSPPTMSADAHVAT